jgi:ADP-ribosylglycohydrolase
VEPAEGTRREGLTRAEAIAGCLLGTAVGDALGLPVEGLSPRRQRRLFGEIRSHRFLLGRGMISDDTEHATMVAQALIAAGGDPRRFSRGLRSKLRWWLLGLPVNVGLATARAILKSYAGLGGVWSAGNGPAMRSAILGVCYGDDPERLRAMVRAAARVTHTDPQAEWGALAVAVAASCEPAELAPRLRALLQDEGGELLALLRDAERSAAAGETTAAFCARQGWERGVTGYTLHTVPAALHAWMRHPRDFRSAIAGILDCGGDADTTAAITGAVAGAHVGKAGIPAEWLGGLWEWPRGVPWIERVAQRLSEAITASRPLPPIPLVWPGVLARNLFFLLVVLAHGLRRLLPPY